MTTPPQEPSPHEPQDPTVWMPGPGDPSTWEPPVDDTGLIELDDVPPPAHPSSEAPTVAFTQVQPSPFAPPDDVPFPEPLLGGPAAVEAAGQAGDDGRVPPVAPGTVRTPGGGPRNTMAVWVTAAVLGVLAAVGVGIVAALMHGDGTPSAGPVTGASATGAPSAASSAPATSAATSTAPSSTAPRSSEAATTAKLQVKLGPIDAAAALTWVRNAGAKPAGEVVDAWTFSDGNGTNVLVETYQVTSRYPGDRAADPGPGDPGDGPGPGDPGDGSGDPGDGTGSPSPTEAGPDDALPNGATSRIYLVAARDGAAPALLRSMTDDNGGVCENDFTAEFAPGSVTVADTDGDGVAEVTVGWYSACRGDPGPMEVKLALMSGKKKFILRGEGLPADTEDLQRYRDEFDVSPVMFDADPASGSWPTGAYAQALKVAKQVYR